MLPDEFTYREDFSEQKNIALALFEIAKQLRNLGFGNASDISQGAIGGLNVRVEEGLNRIADALEGNSE